VTYCGDGITDAEEEWDDGNLDDGDGCSQDWLSEEEQTQEVEEVKVTKAVEGAIASSQAVTGAGAAVAAGVSALNLSAPTGLWQSVNLMQMFLLILLLKIYIPLEIRSYITANGFVSLAFEYPYVHKIGFLQAMIDYFDFLQSDERLVDMDVKYESTFNNTLTLFITLVLVMFFHLMVSPFARCTPDKSEHKWKYYSKIIFKKIFDLFTFTVYIRLILQAFQPFILSSVSEIYEQNWSNGQRIFSYVFAIWIIFLCIGFVCFAAVVAIKKTTQNEDNKKGKLDEFFNGLKQKRSARMYSVLQMVRRFMFITWLLCFKWVQVIVVVCIFAIIQLFYTCLLLYIRYFEKIKDNIIEIYNECVYWVLLILLVYFQTESRWNGVVTNVYMGLMMSCGFFLLAVSLSMLDKNNL